MEFRNSGTTLPERHLNTILFFICQAYLFSQLHKESTKPDNSVHLKDVDLLQIPVTPGLRYVSKNVQGNLLQDVSENDWLAFLKWLSCMPYFLFYMVVSYLLHLIIPDNNRKSAQLCRIGASIILILCTTHVVLVLDVLLLSISGVIAGFFLRRKLLAIWTLYIGIIYVSDYLTDSLYSLPLVPNKFHLVMNSHFFSVLRSLSIALVISSGSYERYKPLSNDICHPVGTLLDRTVRFVWRLFVALCDALEYATYPYTLNFGPLITYKDWLSHRSRETSMEAIQVAGSVGRIRVLTWSSLLKRIGRVIFWYCFWSMALCFIYPNALLSYPRTQSMTDRLAHRDPWRTHGLTIHNSALLTCCYAAGMHFYFIHLLCYATAGILADMDQFMSEPAYPVCTDDSRKALNVGNDFQPDHRSTSHLCLVPAPPSCVHHLPLFSDLWRTFDRGIYNYIMCHLYRPLVDYFNSRGLGRLQRTRPFVTLLLPFIFVLVFHSFSTQNVLWTLFNLLQLLLERSLKWCYRNTNFGTQLRRRLYPGNLERLIFLAKAVSWCFSITGFIIYRYGISLLFHFWEHVLSVKTICVTFLFVFVAQYPVAELRILCGYRGYPIGFKTH